MIFFLTVSLMFLNKNSSIISYTIWMSLVLIMYSLRTINFPFFLHRINKTEVQPFLETMLINLFNLLQVPGSQENEYVMKGMLTLHPVINLSQSSCMEHQVVRWYIHAGDI